MPTRSSSRDPKKKKPYPTKHVVTWQTWKIDSGGGGSPGVGTDVGGGGTVTRVDGSSYTTQFTDGAPTGRVTAAGVSATVTIDYGRSTIRSFEAGKGPFVGMKVPPGGQVTSITGSQITIEFPNGVPDGPITLPGVETTIVDESSGASEKGFVGTVPFGPGDSSKSGTGHVTGDEDGGAPTPDGVHKRFVMPHPGSYENAIRLPASLGLTLLSPTNTSSCNCSIYLASIDSKGRILAPSVKIQRKKGLSLYNAEPGADAIIVAADANCPESGCFTELTVSLGRS